ncbi:MAG: sulfatase [Bacteroidota bacterium]
MKQLNLIFLIFGLFISCSNNQGKIKTGNDSTAPNVLFIAVDDLRPELGIFGASHIQSPAIDKLAAEGLVFNRSYCNIPVCGASRASLLSGVRPGVNRFLGFDTWQEKDYPGVLSLPMHFKNNGYTTISNGKVYHHPQDDIGAWHEMWRPKKKYSPRDFITDENISLDNAKDSRGRPYEWVEAHDTLYKDGRIAKKTIEDLKKLKEKGKPFFLAVGFLKPHLPFNAPKKYWNLYDPESISLPDNYMQPASTPQNAFHNFGELRKYYSVPKQGPISKEMANKLIHGYYACVSYTDAQIGKILTALEDLKLAENTIVILWGDHGWNLGDHMLWCKHCNFESSLHVPMIIKVPGKTSGQKTEVITEYIDIYPSLCDLARLPVPDHIDGESFVPLIEGNSRVKDYAISKYYNGVTLVKENLFYTEFIDKEGNLKTRMLFDHTNDPLELDNLAEKPSYENKVNDLSNFLHANWGNDFFLDRRKK